MAYSEAQPTQETSTVTPEQAAALEAENAQLKTQIQQAVADQAHKANLAFADTLVEAGQLLPAEQSVVVAALDHYDAQPDPLEFGEGDDKQPLGEAFKTFLAGLPKRIEFGEIAGHAQVNGVPAKSGIKVPKGFDVDGQGLALHQRALSYQEQHPEASYLVAINAVTGN